MPQQKPTTVTQDNKKFDAEKLIILEFKVIKGEVNANEDFDKTLVSGHQVQTEFELGFNLELKRIRADLKLSIKSESDKKNKKEASAKFEFIYIFSFEDLSLFAQMNKQKTIDVDAILANTLASLSYSTSRGVLLTRLQGTAMQNFILPVINPANLLSSKNP
jgi:hypothetical protein